MSTDNTTTNNTELKTAIVEILGDFELDNTEEIADFIISNYIKDFNTLQSATITEGSLYSQATLDIVGVEPYTIQILPYTNAEDAWDESLECYIDDYILPELPKQFQNYFDHESWKTDARMDGIYHSLSSYDGGGNESGGLISFHN